MDSLLSCVCAVKGYYVVCSVVIIFGEASCLLLALHDVVRRGVCTLQHGPGKGPGLRQLDVEVIRVGGLSVPPLGVDVVDSGCNVMCLSRNVATNALKVVGLPTLLPQAPGTRGDAVLASKMSGVFSSSSKASLGTASLASAPSLSGSKSAAELRKAATKEVVPSTFLGRSAHRRDVMWGMVLGGSTGGEGEGRRLC